MDRLQRLTHEKRRKKRIDYTYTNQFAWQVISDGAWKGKSCFIIGGGPSLTDFNWDLLKGKLTIGINRVYEKIDPTIIYGQDPRFVRWVLMGKYGGRARTKFLQSSAMKIWLNTSGVDLPKDIYILKCWRSYLEGRKAFPLTMKEGIGHGSNSGYGALNLAACLGANPIYLLGYDMQRENERTHWHNGHPERTPDHVPESFKKHFDAIADVLKRNEITVVNLNPDSALPFFPKKPYTECTELSEESDIERKPRGYKEGSLTLITPTGDRPLAFALCQNWMRKQTLQPDQWIVVDDGKIPMKPYVPMQYIRRKPKSDDPKHTMLLNFKAAMPLVKGEKIIFIEDDEYYAPEYIATMAHGLNQYEIIGIGNSKYYHLNSGKYYRHGNVSRASLAQTAFRQSFLAEFNELLNSGDTYLDIRMWKKLEFSERGFIFVKNFNDNLYVGIKGLPGRPGIGIGHDTDHSMYKVYPRDSSREILKQWTWKDHDIYMDIINGKLTEKNCHLRFKRER